MKFTRREEQIIRLAGCECMNHEALANEMGITPGTVAVYLGRIYAKLRVHEQTGKSSKALLVRYAMMHMLPRIRFRFRRGVE